MEETKNAQQENSTPAKPTYDELKNYCNQLMYENNSLKNQLGHISKLPYLFEVLKNAAYFEPEYTQACATEITKLLPPYVETPKSE